MRLGAGVCGLRLVDIGRMLVDGLVVYSRPYAGRGTNEEFRADGTPLPPLPARAGAVYKVNQFSVDNALDTQRRRGERATVRTIVTA